MTLDEAIAALNAKYPNRVPARYAQNDNTWYLYTENTVNNGRHLAALIENGWFAVTEADVRPVTPLDFPNGLKCRKISR